MGDEDRKLQGEEATRNATIVRAGSHPKGKYYAPTSG